MIDWSRVTDLRDEIGNDDFDEVVALFQEEADEVVQNLPACADAKALESALHFLKGASLNLGFADLAQLCQEGERLSAAGLCGVDTCRVTACYHASKSAFETGRHRLTNPHAA